MISLIAAVDSNFLIGKGDKIPWHYKEDLLFFKQKVANQSVLMGLNTYQSLKSYYKDKSFPFNKIYVVSHSPILDSNVNWVSNLKDF